MEYIVANREQNLSSDSYFYATFWDTETKTYEERPTGSTAGYGGGWLDINAPEEVLEEYRAVRQREIRISDIHFNIKRRKACKEAAHLVGVNFHKVMRLFSVYGQRADKVLKLLECEKGKFKLSLKSQVIDWLKTPEEQRKYGTPLSERQMKYL